jgi:hypothetical protein
MSIANNMIKLYQFRELWIHTGTACNLECPFCLEGSRPGDTRLERIKLNEIKPYLDQAAQLGVERFCFTGGEPLIVKDIVKILEYGLKLKPCMVISNGTAPLLKRLHQLQLLKQQPHSLSFRISIDYPDQHLHDTGRGWGNFQRAIEGLQLLHAQGFAIGVIRQLHAGEDASTIIKSYQVLLRKAHLPEDTPIHALPDFGLPGSQSGDAPVAVSNSIDNAHLKCSHSRMLLKRNGQLQVNSCLFTDDDVNFDLGESLESAISAAVMPNHHRCHQCARCVIEL